jgi:hypothetical protein
MASISISTLFRLSGFALLVALPLQIAGFAMHPPGERVVDLLSPLQGPAHMVLFVSWFLVLLGMPGLYARQADRAGLLGLIGFVATMFAIAYTLYLVLYEAFPAVLLAQNPATQDAVATGGPLAHGVAFGDLGFVTILGFPVFGLAMLRAGVVPRVVGWLQIVYLPALLASIIGLSLILGDAVLPNLPGALQPIAIMSYLLFIGYARGGYFLWQSRELAATSATSEPSLYSGAAAGVA